MSMSTRTLLDNLEFPEDPRWHNGKLWFSDMGTNSVIRTDLHGNLEVVVKVDGTPSGLGWLPDGTMLIVSMADRRVLRLTASGLSEAANLWQLASFNCNDMVVDSQGRAFVGNFGFDFEAMDPFAPGEIILVPPTGQARRVAEDLAFPNGMVITPDERTLIVSETLGECLTAFDIEADGSLSRRRTWAQLDGFTPDGLTLDSEGAVWVASPVSGGVFRVKEGGVILQKIPVANQAYSCTLGGLNRKTLFIATSSPLPSLFILMGLHPEDVDPLQVKVGKIEIVEVDVPGAGFP